MSANIKKLFTGFILLMIPFTLLAQQEDSVDYNEWAYEKAAIFERTVSFTGVGDIMLGTAFPEKYYLPPHDGQYLLDSVKPYIQEADFAFGNLEGTYLNQDVKPTKRCSNPKRCYAFRSPEHYMGYVKEAGFDFLSMANNHSGDWGLAGRTRTQELVDSLGMKHAGLLETPFTILEKDSLKIGFAAFAPNSGCMQLNDLDRALEIVRHLDSTCDIVLISFHGGAEGSKYQHVAKKTEYYLGENRGDLRKFTHSLVDAGADIIFGHGPHVTRGMEIYKDRFIAYSLGNFATYARFNLSGVNGYCPLVQIHTSKSGEFLRGKIIPIEQTGEGHPRVDQDKRAIKKLQQLSTADFPRSELVIKDDGTLWKLGL